MAINILPWLPALWLCPAQKRAAAPSCSPLFQTDGPPAEPETDQEDTPEFKMINMKCSNPQNTKI